MAAYNADATIRRAVTSILDGTCPCDLFIVDDSSRNPVAELLADIPNIEIIRLDQNRGLAGALNAGLARILERPYTYIARMDADDISHPQRLAKQVAFLDRHPVVGAVSTWGRHVDEHSYETVLFRRPSAEPAALRNEMFFNSPLIHASSMMRAEVFRAVGPYSLDYPAAEDYEIFRRIATKYALGNVPEVLIDIRESRQGISRSKRSRQVYDRLRIQLRYFEPLEWRAWAGVAQTLLTLALPLRAADAIKRLREQVLFGQPKPSAS
jgi:glycosyltransferase involved in cell wall biosynthesis